MTQPNLQATAIRGLSCGPELDTEVFGRLKALRQEGEDEYAIGRRLVWRRDGRYQAIAKEIKVIKKDLTIGRPLDWLVLSGVVKSRHVQLVGGAGWHADDMGGTLLATDQLPTEVMAVELDSGELSCQKIDAQANVERWQAICQAGRDDQALLAIPGVNIVPLEAGGLYYLNSEALHRSPKNLTGLAIDRTLIALYPTLV